MRRWRTSPTHHELVTIEMLAEDDTVLTRDSSTEWLVEASFMFSVHDVSALQRHIEASTPRHLSWQEELGRGDAQLVEELRRHPDVIVVDVLDVYRNLPQKLLLCHAWIHERYSPSFVMKTDDDCFVNLKSILGQLPSLETAREVWWGNFRSNWAVERHGKWREPHFSSSVYPKFACGSGYVVSKNIHGWFIQNKDLLRKFQGEDVSTGIWLSVLDIEHIQDDRWQCAMSCESDALSVPELDADGVWWHWNNSKHCSSPCSAC